LSEPLQTERGRLQIRFRPVADADCGLLYSWLCNPAVAKWWTPPASRNEVVEKYVHRAGENDDFRSYVILLDALPIGYIQSYEDGSETVGIDLFIGEDAYRHQGLGATIIRSFLEDVFGRPAIKRCIVDPSPENTIAISAYQKAGFRRSAQQPDPKTVLMEVEREAE